ncbi:hypothetical protein [Geobacillus thermocatenulatus]|nr:hypothetical protein [Geobacillus thermocatenulatus]
MGNIQPRRLITVSGRPIVVRTASPEDAERHERDSDCIKSLDLWKKA